MIYAYSEIDATKAKRHLPIQVFAFGVISLDLGGILGIAFRHKFAGVLPMATVGVIYAAVCLGVCVYRELVRLDSEDERFAARRGSGDEDRLFVSPVGPTMSMVDSISRQCHETARQYALSSREEEVLAYLVRGKSAKTIADNTYISYNTIKTHMSHIYHKMNIHSREEMIQIVESVSLEE
jgi:DNA-binding CsgD family transcriptional regulator